jgi:hypothetical protein
MISIIASTVVIGAIATLALPSIAQRKHTLELQAIRIQSSFEFTLDHPILCTRAMQGQVVSDAFHVGPFQKGAFWDDWAVASVKASRNDQQRGAIDITMTLRHLHVFPRVAPITFSKTVKITTEPRLNTIVACEPL